LSSAADDADDVKFTPVGLTLSKEDGWYMPDIEHIGVVVADAPELDWPASAPRDAAAVALFAAAQEGAEALVRASEVQDEKHSEAEKAAATTASAAAGAPARASLAELEGDNGAATGQVLASVGK
jgi:hypothetical protein